MYRGEGKITLEIGCYRWDCQAEGGGRLKRGYIVAVREDINVAGLGRENMRGRLRLE